MIDMNKIDKTKFEKANGTIENDKIKIFDIDNYAHVIGIENVFDKNIRIKSSRGSEAWGEIPTTEEFDENDEGLVWMAGQQYSPTYICYAYQIINFKQNAVIGYQIYCLNEIAKLDEAYFNSFEDLKINLNLKFNLVGNWSTDYIQHNYG